MRIGIVGKGKMGLDIFSYFLDRGCELVLVVRREEDVQTLSSKITKQFDRMKKRGVLDEKDYEKKVNSFKICTSYKELGGCNLVIESVIEDLSVKQEIMEKIEENVNEDCIIASNSSSLDLDRVFERCHNTKRCMGLHFFFPVKYIEYVEINKADCTESQYAMCLNKEIRNLGKKVLFLQKNENYLLSKMITVIVSYSYLLYCEGKMSIDQIDRLIKNELIMFGPFEMMDSTGLVIINQCTDSFLTKRYYDMIKNIGDEVKRALENGYAGGLSEKGFKLFEQEQKEAGKEFDTSESEAISDEYLKRIKAVVCNEIAYLHNERGVDGSQCMEAVEEILGFRKKIKEIYHDVKSGIHDVLKKDYQKYNIPCMQEEAYTLYE